MTEPEPGRDDIELFVARNRARLLAAYDASRAGRLSFCWPGLLFPQAWFLYRKMYVWAAVVTVGPLALAKWPAGAYLDWFATILGALGLKLYFASAERIVSRLRRDFSPEEASARIARAGGVSQVGAAVGLVYIFAVFLLTLKSGPNSLLPLR